MPSFHYRILVVDSDEQLRRMLTLVLSKAGYEVRTAKDGFDALAQMRQGVPELMITDLNMPNMSGFELLSVVRRRFPQIEVIVITGHFIGRGHPEGLLADALFDKGQFSPPQLLDTVQQLLAQSPVRASHAKPDKAPVWIPRNGEYYVVTCTECLRSFSLPLGEPTDVAREATCVHCGSQVRFILEPKG